MVEKAKRDVREVVSESVKAIGARRFGDIMGFFK